LRTRRLQVQLLPRILRINIASHKASDENRPGQVEVGLLRGNPMPVFKRLGDQFVQVLPLLPIE
jgi:hypothetical protein